MQHTYIGIGQSGVIKLMSHVCGTLIQDNREYPDETLSESKRGGIHVRYPYASQTLESSKLYQEKHTRQLEKNHSQHPIWLGKQIPYFRYCICFQDTATYLFTFYLKVYSGHIPLPLPKIWTHLPTSKGLCFGKFDACMRTQQSYLIHASQLMSMSQSLHLCREQGQVSKFSATNKAML